jgi:hypothetical protein
MYACMPRGCVCGSKLPCCSSSTDTGQCLLVHRCTTALENCPPNIEANSQTLSRWASCISDTRSKLMESKIREQQILVAQSAEICAFWVEGFGFSSACTAIKRDFPHRCKRKEGEGNVLPCLLRIPLALQYPREPHVSRGFTSTRRFWKTYSFVQRWLVYRQEIHS